LILDKNLLPGDFSEGHSKGVFLEEFLPVIPDAGDIFRHIRTTAAFLTKDK